jgi:hypothetical protein
VEGIGERIYERAVWRRRCACAASVPKRRVEMELKKQLPLGELWRKAIVLWGISGWRCPA